MKFPLLPIMIRAFPSFFAIIIANRLHYNTLRAATTLARIPKKEGGGGRLASSFELTRSLPMRRVRYWIKLVRYSSTSVFLLLAYPFLPELQDPTRRFEPLSLFTLLLAFFSSLAVIFLRENKDEKMRTLWQPSVDFKSSHLGTFFDSLRIVGSIVAVPVEEELLFRALIYRFLVTFWLSNYDTFVDVPFHVWNWKAAILTSLLYGVLHGGEWLSSAVSGFLFQLVVVKEGSLISGITAHALKNAIIGLWVVVKGQREYW